LDEGGSELALPFEDGTPSWAVVVMHMHSNRWEGAFTPEEMVEHYRRIGADAVVVTDHNRLTRPRHPAAPLPAYEHGWGPHNHHVLVLGAEETLPEGEPFGGRDPLARLHRLREQSSAFLVLAHPNSSRAWPRTLLRRPDLDADAIELFNKSAISLDRWDDALSAGHLLWGTAGDDCHDLRSRHQTAKRYLLVDLRDFDRNRSSHPTGEQLLSALRQGRFLACWQGRHEDTRRLPVPGQPLPTRFEVDGEGVTVYLDRPAEMVEIVEPGGAIVETLASAPSFRLAPPHGVLYQRALLRHGSHTIAFNPVARLRATL
jgi:hypothetical protein